MGKIIKIVLEIIVLGVVLFYYNVISFKGIIKKGFKNDIKEVHYYKNPFSTKTSNRYLVIIEEKEAYTYEFVSKNEFFALKSSATSSGVDVNKINIIVLSVGLMIMIIIPMLRKPK